MSDVLQLLQLLHQLEQNQLRIGVYLVRILLYDEMIV